MDEFQILLSKLHNFQQQLVTKSSEFEKLLAAGTDQDGEKEFNEKISSLEAAVENQLKVHRKVAMDNKLVLKHLQKDTELKRSKVNAKEKLITTLEEELRHLKLNMEQHSLTQGPKDETTNKRLEEEETRSMKHLGLEIKKIKVGDCQPEISEMNTLLSKLNSSNDLGKFVHSVRKRFTNLVNK